MSRRRKGRRIDATGRSKGEGQYFVIPYSMAHSTAFRSLSGPALRIFIEIRCRFNGGNNGHLSLSWNDGADKLSISKTTVGRAFKELEAKGFLKLRKRGHWYGRLAAEYIVTDCQYDGNPPTRDWERWRPPLKPEKRNTVPTRTRQRASGPAEYRAPDFAVRVSTRQATLRVIDGSG